MSRPPIPNFAGRLLDGRWRLMQRLELNYYGMCYVATDEREGRPVHATLIFGEALTDTPERAALIAFAHPRVSRLLAAGVEDGQIWVVREALDDRLLSDELGAGPLSLGRVLSLVTAVCEGVAALHAAGLVHGVVLPQHVYVGYPESARATAGAEVKLIDPVVPGTRAERPDPASDVAACAELLERLLEKRAVPPSVAALRGRSWASAAELGAACAECLRALPPDERDAIPNRIPPPPPPTGIPMPTNWSPPPPRPPFRYTQPAVVLTPLSLMPTNWSPPPPADPPPRSRAPIAVAAVAAVAAAALLGWWLLR